MILAGKRCRQLYDQNAVPIRMVKNLRPGNNQPTVAVIVTAFSTNITKISNMELNEIISSARITDGKMRLLNLNEEGKKKFSEAYSFVGEFFYSEQDFDLILKLMQRPIDNGKYVVEARGFIAGHRREFNGEVSIFVKHKIKSYSKETIQLDGIGCGTIAVMEWIEAHGCPDLDTVYFNEGQRDVLVVSNMKNNELFIERDKMGDIDWYKVPVNGKTALRYHEGFWWIFKINGKYYFATT